MPSELQVEERARRSPRGGDAMNSSAEACVLTSEAADPRDPVPGPCARRGLSSTTATSEGPAMAPVETVARLREHRGARQASFRPALARPSTIRLETSGQLDEVADQRATAGREVGPGAQDLGRLRFRFRRAAEVRQAARAHHRAPEETRIAVLEALTLRTRAPAPAPGGGRDQSPRRPVRQAMRIALRAVRMSAGPRSPSPSRHSR